MVSHVLGVPSHAVTVEIRRMGGGFGGKETQGNQFAALAAIAAKKLNRAVKIRPDRDDDMTATGKRHDFLIDYEVGFDDDGNILGVDSCLRRALRLLVGPVRPGHRPGAVPLRQRLFLAGGAGASRRRSTPTPCPTPPFAASAARRAWSAPSASSTRWPLPPARTRSRSASAISTATPSRNVTPYHQTVEDNIIQRIVAELEESADYARPPARDRRLQRQQPHHQARPGADAGEVRHLVHRHALQPGRRAGACLHRRLGAPEPWRHRDGAGALRQGRAGRGRRVPDRHRPGEDHRDDHRQGAEHLGHRRLVRRRPQRHGGAERGAHRSSDRLCRLRRPTSTRCRSTRSCSCPTGCASATRRSPSPSWSSRPTWRASSCRPPASTRRRRSTGTATRARAIPSTISPMARPARKSRSTR